MGEGSEQASHQRRSTDDNISKDAPQHMSPGDCSLKQQDITCVAKIKTGSTKRGIGRGAAGVLTHCWWEGNMVFCGKTKDTPTIRSSNHPAIHPKEQRTSVHTKPCTRMFTAALSRIAKTWNQPRCPSVGDG